MRYTHTREHYDTIANEQYTMNLDICNVSLCSRSKLSYTFSSTIPQNCKTPQTRPAQTTTRKTLTLLDPTPDPFMSAVTHLVRTYLYAHPSPVRPIRVAGFRCLNFSKVTLACHQHPTTPRRRSGPFVRRGAHGERWIWGITVQPVMVWYLPCQDAIRAVPLPQGWSSC